MRARCRLGVEVLEVPIDDSWARDSGPIFTLGQDGKREGVDFRFNSWGERFKPFDSDAAMSARVLESLGIERVASEMVLEGGAISVDGQGTALTTEQCLLNPNRNPGMSREQMEEELSLRLGIDSLIWLPWGQAEDAHTDGHVDGACLFVEEGKVLAQTCEDPDNPNYELMAANLEVLKSATDVDGRPLEVIEFPHLPYFDLDGEPMVVSYVNLYVANGGVVLPLAGHPLDEPALDLIGTAFPDREVVGVPGRIVSFGGGGPHRHNPADPRPGAAMSEATGENPGGSGTDGVPWGCDSDVGRLTRVLMSPPTREGLMADPLSGGEPSDLSSDESDEGWYWLPGRCPPRNELPVDEMRRQWDRLVSALEEEGVEVLTGTGTAYGRFACYTRDAAFLGPDGAILGQLPGLTRKGEEKWASRSMAEAGVPVVAEIDDEGQLEGGSVVWINPTALAIGLSNCVNEAAAVKIEQVLEPHRGRSDPGPPDLLRHSSRRLLRDHRFQARPSRPEQVAFHFHLANRGTRGRGRTGHRG